MPEGGKKLLSVIREYHGEKKRHPEILKAILERGRAEETYRGGWREKKKEARCGGMEKEKG